MNKFPPPVTSFWRQAALISTARFRRTPIQGQICFGALTLTGWLPPIRPIAGVAGAAEQNIRESKNENDEQFLTVTGSTEFWGHPHIKPSHSNSTEHKKSVDVNEARS